MDNPALLYLQLACFISILFSFLQMLTVCQIKKLRNDLSKSSGVSAYVEASLQRNRRYLMFSLACFAITLFCLVY